MLFRRGPPCRELLLAAFHLCCKEEPCLWEGHHPSQTDLRVNSHSPAVPSLFNHLTSLVCLSIKWG